MAVGDLAAPPHPARTAPKTADRIHHQFSHILDTAAGRAEELVALGQPLQAYTTGVHPTLTPHIADRAEPLTGTPVPAL